MTEQQLTNITLERARLNANLAKQLLNERGVAVTEDLRNELQVDLYDNLYVYFKKVLNDYPDFITNIVRNDVKFKDAQKMAKSIDEKEKAITYATMHKWETLNFGKK